MFKLGTNETTDKPAEKVQVLNEIFKDVISDATELIKDLSWSVKTYLLFGLIMILFGIQTFASNVETLQEQLYIPLFISVTLIFAGSVQIIQYFRLRRKYSRLFKAREELLTC